MVSAYSTEVSELFTKVYHHHNISLILITRFMFRLGSSSPDITLHSNYVVLFRKPRDKTQIVNLAQQGYHANISSFHKTYLDACKDLHTYFFLDVT